MRTTPSAITMLTILLFSALSVCQKADDGWVTKGTIQMDKLISLDSLWEKREELQGEIVTLELGPATSTYNGNSKPIRGHLYYHTGMFFDTIRDADWNDIESFLEKKDVAFKDGDTIYLGFTCVNIANRGDEKEKLPVWIHYTKKINTFSRDSIIYPLTNSNKKVITGFFLGGYSNYRELKHPKIKYIYYRIRNYEIYPLGMKFRKKQQWN
ncbi:MAG: hypothetical protein ACOC41_07345 [Chitinivibrionales bacterium]